MRNINLRPNIVIVDDIDTEIKPKMNRCKYNPDKECAFRIYCENYSCDHKPEQCDHKDTSIVVIEATVTCEKTAIQCDYCGKILTEPENDCR